MGRRIHTLLGALVLLPGLALSQALDVVLVLDNSGSMKRNDPARLTATAVERFISRQDSDTRVGIVLFASQPRLLVPLTPVTDASHPLFRDAMQQLNYSGRWTETAEAVERALYELRVNGRKDASKALLLMTDGIIDTGNAVRNQERADWLRSSLVLDAQRNDVHVFGLAFTEEADYQMLQFLAQATGGEYYRAFQPGDLAPTLDHINDALRDDARFAYETIPVPAPDAVVATEAGATEPAATPDITPTQTPDRLVYQTPGQEPAAVADQTGIADERNGAWSWVLPGLLLIAVFAGAGFLYVRRDKWQTLFGATASAPGPDDEHGPKAVLYDVHDPSDIKRHELGPRPVVIGRVSGNDTAMDYIVVDERTIGRWHATIERRGQSFWIRDEGSVNGTFVNDQKIGTEHPLKHGDLVRVHKHEFEFVIPELFDSDRTVMANEGGMARAREEARRTATATG